MDQGVKIIFIHGYYQNLQAASIVQNDKKSGYLATKKLLENKLTKIGGIFKFNDLQGRQRYEGFVDAMNDFGCAWSETDVLWLNSHQFSFETNKAFCWDFIKNKKTLIRSGFLEDFILNHDGLVIYNEQIAVTVMDYVKRKNLKIPQDVSVVSFDDSDIAVTYEPKITTISHPKSKLGKLAAETLLAMIQNELDADVNIVLEPELIVRDSVRSYGSVGREEHMTY